MDVCFHSFTLFFWVVAQSGVNLEKKANITNEEVVMVVDLPPWLSGLTLSELQCSEPGWLASSAGRGFFSHSCRHVESGFCML